MFPKTIYFCHKTLDQMKYSSDYWNKMNPNYVIKLFDDNMCKQFLKTEYSQLYLDVFNFLPDGPIKADFWRICILYKYGGVYSDIDNEPLIPLDDFIEDDIDFATCSSFSPEYNFNPNFIISKKNNIILKKCIDWYIDNFNKKSKYSYWKFSIMSVFTQVLKLDNYNKEWGIYYLDNMKIQILKEYLGKHHYDAHNIYRNIRVFNDRYQNWDCEKKIFTKESVNQNKIFVQGLNLDWVLFTLYNKIIKLFEKKNKIEVILFNDSNSLTKNSLWLNKIPYKILTQTINESTFNKIKNYFYQDSSSINDIQKIISIYNYLLRTRAEYIIYLDSSELVISNNLNHVLKSWKESFVTNKILFDDNKLTNNNNIVHYLTKKCWISKKEIALVLIKEVLNKTIQNKQKLLIKNHPNTVLNSQLFIKLNLAEITNCNEDSIKKYKQKKIKQIQNYYLNLSKIPVMISAIIILYIYNYNIVSYISLTIFSIIFFKF